MRFPVKRMPDYGEFRRTKKFALFPTYCRLFKKGEYEPAYYVWLEHYELVERYTEKARTATKCGTMLMDRWVFVGRYVYDN